jgi:hypothetical protein
VKRVAIIVGLVASALVMLLLALRMPAARGYLIDLPGVGPVFEWVSELVHGPSQRHPINVLYALDHHLSPSELATARDRLARLTMLPTRVQGYRLVVHAGPDDDQLRALVSVRRDPIRVFVVVYQSEELDRVRKALRTDEQAKRLGLTVELDRVGYHVHAPDELMYVNPDWADAHHCTGHRIEGTGIACPLSPKQRLDAYVRGDAGLFTDPHRDLLAAPPGRGFYIEDDGDAYELEATPVTIAPMQLAGIDASGDDIELTLAPDAAAAIAARATTSDVQLVAELAPGALHAVTLAGPGKLALAVGPGAQRIADELALAGLGLHEVQ